jgi:putative oxidoreductase
LRSRLLLARSRVRRPHSWLYTRWGTALIGHQYWTVKGADYVDSLEGFYKDLSITGGFLLLYITDAGKYSIDALFSIAAP